MDMKKLLLITTSIVTEVVASQSGESKQHIAHSWYAKLMTYWERLGTHMQLAIQLMLVLITIYALTCFFKCDKKCGCVGSGCNCSQVENGCVSSKPDCKCHLDCTDAPDYTCNVKCDCEPTCQCGSECDCDLGCTCGDGCNCNSSCNCGCQK